MYYRNMPGLVRIQSKVMELSDNYVSSPAVVSDFEEEEEED